MSQALPIDSSQAMAREQQRQAFLALHGHADASVEALAADASARRYFRLSARGLLLMDSPPASEPIAPFVQVAQLLSSIGLSAPRIVAADMQQGLALIEDFGHNTYTRLLVAGHAMAPLYELAVDALAHLHSAAPALAAELPPYDGARLVEEAALFADWYVPLLSGKPCSAAFRAQFLGLFAQVCTSVSMRRDALVLRDFHVDNLMLLDGRSGVAACGLLDFQDALQGAPAYDLMSLLEDARRDVPADLQAKLLARYHRLRPQLADSFMDDYAVLAAQRHAKVLGIFVRLGLRDGKYGYLDHLPRVLGLFVQALEHPLLHPLRDLLDREFAQWQQGPSPEAIAALRTRSL